MGRFTKTAGKLFHAVFSEVDIVSKKNTYTLQHTQPSPKIMKPGGSMRSLNWSSSPAKTNTRPRTVGGAKDLLDLALLVPLLLFGAEAERRHWPAWWAAAKQFGNKTATDGRQVPKCNKFVKGGRSA